MREKGEASGLLMILILLIVFMSGILLFGQKELSNLPGQQNQKNEFCRPLPITSSSPQIKAPPYTHVGTSPAPNTFETDVDKLFPKINKNDIKTYKLIKAKIPFLIAHTNYYSPNELRSTGPGAGELKCPEVVVSADGGAHHHFCQWIHDAVVPSPNTSGSTKYAVLYPASWSGNPGFSSPFKSTSKTDQILYADYQLIFLAHLKEDNTLLTFEGKDSDGNKQEFAIYDVYQQVSDNNPNQAKTNLPDNVFDCQKSQEEGRFTIYSNSNPNNQSDKKQLQLDTFVPSQFDVERNWYYPMCKPAIYLYPQNPTDVNVKVKTTGFLTYTDPLYPKEGWTVKANPDGTIDSQGKIYDYLYYESKIPDLYINKPNKGFIVPFYELPAFYENLLPKLGLSEKQTEDFKNYWTKALHYSPYYFVGVMKTEDIEKIEPLSIIPKPLTLVRVRLYFEALNNLIPVEKPSILTPQKEGFTVVEWGGMVKTDKNNPFTCSQ
ncbi:MAG: hypothetical protein Q8P80_00390 [Candidatus Levybacteria bacterium]|nr:hypothetical protein [Candidatus Levybacteria bacterium]